MVEKDYNYPGGFYVRHKDAHRFCITGTRWDIENMAENALASLDLNCGRVLLNTEEEKNWLIEVKGVVLEGLDRQMLNWLDMHGVDNSFVKKQFFMDLLWKMLSDVRVNDRVPEYVVNLGKGMENMKVVDVNNRS